MDEFVIYGLGAVGITLGIMAGLFAFLYKKSAGK